jgi:hypothetical protein
MKRKRRTKACLKLIRCLARLHDDGFYVKELRYRIDIQMADKLRITVERIK